LIYPFFTLSQKKLQNYHENDLSEKVEEERGKKTGEKGKDFRIFVLNAA